MAPEKSIQSYQDLLVWQAGMILAEACYRATKEYPREEMFGLTSQIRRAAASIPANIAEGHGRENSGSFVQFLRVAQGSTKELEMHLLLSKRVGILGKDSLQALLGQCEEIGKMLRALIRSIQRKGSDQ